MLHWNEQFETGHPLIDSQHQMLISYLNRLEAMTRNTNPSRQEVEFILNLIDFVETYTLVHFKHEEGCMIRFRCPAHAENKLAHQQFLEYFREFKRRFEIEGCRPDVLRELQETFAGWIQQHILNIDLRLKPCLAPNIEKEA
jgi:hemerythrin